MTDALAEQVARALQRRAGWRLEATATPGSPLLWCFSSSRQIELSVRVDAGRLQLCAAAEDREVELESVEALVLWLRAHRPDAFGPERTRMLDRLRRGRMFSWD